jgi:hypothetical protein
MKRSLIAVAIAFSTNAATAGALSGEPTLDRTLPTYPELGMDSAGLLVAEGKYRTDAGQPTQDLVVQDYGSA